MKPLLEINTVSDLLNTLNAVLKRLEELEKATGYPTAYTRIQVEETIKKIKETI